MKNIYYLKAVILLLMINLSFSNSYAQENYIYNGGFETPDGDVTDVNSYPSFVAQVDKMASWESRTSVPISNGGGGFLFYHSPDWINSQGNNVQDHSSFPHGDAHNGFGYVGLGNYEMIQQQFRNQDMTGGHVYSVSFYIKLSDYIGNTWEGSTIKVRMSKTRMVYRNELTENIPSNQDVNSFCDIDYINFKYNDWTEIASIPIDLASYPASGWHRVTKTFVAPNDISTWTGLGDYEFISIDLEKNNVSGGNCSDGYIFIDDVVLAEAEYCDAICSPTLPALSFLDIVSGPPNNQYFLNVVLVSNAPWYFIVANAIGIEFNVYDSWGQILYTQTAFDVIGLKDQGFPDYAFAWMGKLSNGNTLPQDVYNYSVRIWNCNEEYFRLGSITVLNDNINSQPQKVDPFNGVLPNCCPNELYIQNYSYNSAQLEAATNFITAGENVTSGTVGPVIINSGANVKYVSHQINLEPGFIVQAGANYEGIIDECTYYQDYGRVIGTSWRPAEEINTESELSLFPNPSKGIVHARIINGKIRESRVINITGQSAKVSVTESDLGCFFDLSNNPNGIYFIEITTLEGARFTGKVSLFR